MYGFIQHADYSTHLDKSLWVATRYIVWTAAFYLNSPDCSCAASGSYSWSIEVVTDGYSQLLMQSGNIQKSCASFYCS